MTTPFEISSFTEVGARTNNEDSIYPDLNREEAGVLEDNNLFLVCDGMGGHAKGEIASDLICTQLPAYFKRTDIAISNEGIIEDAVAFVESKFDAYINNFPDAYGMGSTLTLLHLHQKGATIAHIGDSRVYQIRNGEIIFRTEDHSQVYALYKSGVITKEEMYTHPNKNVILKAIMGAKVRPVKPDVKLVTDLQGGDIFFLCTDGVIDCYRDEELERVFMDNTHLDALTSALVKKCREMSGDNFSGYFIKLKEQYIRHLAIHSEAITANTVKEKSKPEQITRIAEPENMGSAALITSEKTDTPIPDVSNPALRKNNNPKYHQQQGIAGETPGQNSRSCEEEKMIRANAHADTSFNQPGHDNRRNKAGLSSKKWVTLCTLIVLLLLIIWGWYVLSH